MDRYYITTPIYYPSGEPHLGHVYTTTCADAVARHHRLMGRDVFFLTGTDEHGVKMVNTAAKEGVTPKEMADRYAATFRETFERLGMSNDHFIRTTDPDHEAAVTKIVEKLQANGDIYKAKYEGWYDEGEERFVPENEAKANDFKSDVSGRPLVRHEEETYFFKLTKYVPQVLAHIESNPDFIRPESRRNMVLAGLRKEGDGAVEDLSISRASIDWGVPMPGDPAHVLYVWIDALSNYITALNYPDGERFSTYWPASHHLIGKEILWFHAVYWPAMLMALGEDLPRRLFAHGWWTSEGQKMSKSLGNYVGLAELDEFAGLYGEDAVRYYLLWAAPFGNDLDFSRGELHRSYEELQKVLGNLLNRVGKMVGKYRDGVVPNAKVAPEDAELADAVALLPERIDHAYRDFRLQEAATMPIDLCRAANGYIDRTEPFKLAKDEARADRLDQVLSLSTRAVHAALVALRPVLRDKADDGLRQLGVDPAAGYDATPAKLGEVRPLFPRVEVE